MSLPSTRVVCLTRTPGTSVIPLRSPAGSEPERCPGPGPSEPAHRASRAGSRVEQQHARGDLLMRGHAGYPRQLQHRVRPPRGAQRRRQPQRVGEHLGEALLGEPVRGQEGGPAGYDLLPMRAPAGVEQRRQPAEPACRQDGSRSAVLLPGENRNDLGTPSLNRCILASCLGRLSSTSQILSACANQVGRTGAPVIARIGTFELVCHHR